MSDVDDGDVEVVNAIVIFRLLQAGVPPAKLATAEERILKMHAVAQVCNAGFAVTFVLTPGLTCLGHRDTQICSRQPRCLSGGAP